MMRAGKKRAAKRGGKRKALSKAAQALDRNKDGRITAADFRMRRNLKRGVRISAMR